MHPRAPATLEVRYRVTAEDAWSKARATDLSANGLGLRTPAALEVGGTLDAVRVALPAEEGEDGVTLQLGAQVVRCAPTDDEKLPFLAGLRFLDLEDPEQERINHFVFRRLREVEATDATESPARRIPFTQPIAIRFELFKDFVNEISANLSTSGMFIQTSRPRPVGTVFDFRFEMGEDFTIIGGRGEVIWIREEDKGPEHPPGMGVRFVHLDSASENVIRRMVEDYVRSGFTPFDLDAELAPDLPLGNGEPEEEEEEAEPADLEEVASFDPVAGLAGLGAEIDREARSDELERELTSTAAERDQLGRRLRATRDEKEALERELAAISAEVQQSQSGLREQVAELKASREAAEGALASARRELELLKEKLTGHDEQAEDLGARIEKLTQERDDLATQLDETRRDREASGRRAEEDRAGVEAKLTAVRQESQELLARIAELENQSADTSTETVQLRSRVGQLEKENELQRRELDAEISSREALAEKHDRAVAEAESTRQVLAERERELESRQQELDERTGQNESARQEVDRLEGRVTELEADLERDRDEAASKASELRREIEERDAQIGEHEKQAGEAASQLAAETERGRELAADRDRAREEAEALGERIRELDEKAARAESENERLRDRLEKLEGEHRELEREAASATGRAAASAARLDDLENELVTARESASPGALPEASYPPDDSSVPRPGGVRPLQIAAGVLIGMLALFAGQRLGLPLPGSPPVPAETSDPAPAASSVEAPLDDKADPAPDSGDGSDRSPSPGEIPTAEVPNPSVLENAVLAWARAWSDQRVDDYLASYAPEFVPEDGSSRAAWEEQRRERVARPASLEITIGPTTREAVSAERFRVTFRQAYASPTYSDEVVKTLEMVWVEGAWKIARETSQLP